MMGTRLLAIVLLGLWPIYCTAELAFNLVHSISTAPSSHRGPHILFRDEHPPDSLTRTPLRTNRINVHCPRKQSLVNQYSFVSSGLDDWDSIEVDAPDVEDRLTLLELAKMTGNAYAKKGQKNWYDVGQNWNMVRFFPPSRTNVRKRTHSRRAFLLAGKMTTTAFEVMFSSPTTTRL
jgi:hypothetical protein